jgi:hypothetical protein
MITERGSLLPRTRALRTRAKWSDILAASLILTAFASVLVGIAVWIFRYQIPEFENQKDTPSAASVE